MKTEIQILDEANRWLKQKNIQSINIRKIHFNRIALECEIDNGAILPSGVLSKLEEHLKEFVKSS